MGATKYLKIKIDESDLDITDIEALPISISYKLEDREEFQKKQSSEAFDIDAPITPNNDKIFNTYHNAGSIDLSPNGTYKKIRNFYLEAGGAELLIGKAFLKKSLKKRNLPEKYQINAYGKNADWLIDLREKTLYDILSTCDAGGPLSFPWTKVYIESTWAFDGTDEAMPFVFAPVKYNGPMDPVALNDENYAVETMRPSMSVYFLLYWAFKSIGYKIDSAFFEQFYGRRLVMPWTWGNYLNTEHTKYDVHRFTAASAVNPLNQYGYQFSMGRGSGSTRYVDLRVTDVVNNNGAGDYTYAAPVMTWTYNAPDYSSLNFLFSLSVEHNSTLTGTNSTYGIIHEWYKNGVLFNSGVLFSKTGSVFTTFQSGFLTVYCEVTVAIGDVIDVKIKLAQQAGAVFGSVVSNTIRVTDFRVEKITIPLGSTISMDSYLQFKNYKILDLLGGVVDLFNMQIDTDNVNKTVLLESCHTFYPFNSPVTSPILGFYQNRLNWTSKQDLSKEEIMELFSDHEREFYFKFRDDSSDGGLKQIMDRAQTVLASGKYVFSDRFKAGKRVMENRFFAATCHYNVKEFEALNGTAPQFICILSENISNRSANQSENTFLPKIAFYHGDGDDPEVTGIWKFDGVQQISLPYMYAVNYKPGGHENPILSYCDENIDSVIGRGLMKRAFLKRLAIMENGQRITKSFFLNNNDIIRKYHRELIRVDDQKWELHEINGYKPLQNESTECFLVKDVDFSATNAAACYPSSAAGKSILAGVMLDDFDVKYSQLLRLPTDK